MKEGDVVLTPPPQADGQVKNRPAIILREMPPYGDFLLCGVSTQVHHEVAGFDDPIRPGDTDFATSGLKAASLIRLGFLAVLPASSLLGTIGSIDNVRHVRLLERLSNHLRPAAAATGAEQGDRDRREKNRGSAPSRCGTLGAMDS